MKFPFVELWDNATWNRNGTPANISAAILDAYEHLDDFWVGRPCSSDLSTCETHGVAFTGNGQWQPNGQPANIDAALIDANRCLNDCQHGKVSKRTIEQCMDNRVEMGGPVSRLTDAPDAPNEKEFEQDGAS